MVSRQAILEECANHFPELLPWVSWCYGQHPYLWHQLGILTSEQGVQQGDPLGPLLYALVLQKVVISISKDSCCADLLLHRWYLDDGAIAGSAVAVSSAVERGGGGGVHYPGPRGTKGAPRSLRIIFSNCVRQPFRLQSSTESFFLHPPPPPPPLVKSAESGQHPPLVKSAESGQHPPPPPPLVKSAKSGQHPPPHPPRSLNRPKAVQGQGGPRGRPSPGPNLALNGPGCQTCPSYPGRIGPPTWAPHQPFKM